MIGGSKVISVSGPVVSTAHVRSAGVGSGVPAVSTERTLKICGPSASELYVWPEAHGVKAALSSEHSKVEPGSFDSKVNAADVEVPGPLGPVRIVVSGGVVSTVHVRSIGVGSTFPKPSVARTTKE